ncbi:MAG: hypothetical protein IRZ26_07530, partial [Clostridia bacterium]|nr:hypothetical protein [Clostridia bacterium]
MSGAAARRPTLLPALLLAAVLAGACGLPAPAAGGPAVRPLPSRPLEPARIAPFPGPLDLARDGSALWVTPAGDVYVQEGSGARAAPRLVARGWRAAFWYRGGLGIVGLRPRGGSFQVVYRLPGGGQETLGTTDAPAQVQVTAGGWVAWPLAGDLEMADPVTESRSRRPGLLRGAERFRLAPDGRQVALARAGRLERVTLTPAGRGSGPEAETLGPLAGAAAPAGGAARRGGG